MVYYTMYMYMSYIYMEYTWYIHGYTNLSLAKAAVGYHPFGHGHSRPRDKFPEPLLARAGQGTKATGAVPRGPTECNATEGFLGCVWHVPAGRVVGQTVRTLVRRSALWQ